MGHDEAEIRPPRQMPHLALEAVPRPQVVGVEKGHELAARVLQAGITGARHPAVGLAPKAYVVARRDRRAGVGRAIVDHDHLGWRIGLGDGALDGRGQVRRAVVDRNDDADERRAQLRASRTARTAGPTAVSSEPSSRM